MSSPNSFPAEIKKWAQVVKDAGIEPE